MCSCYTQNKRSKHATQSQKMPIHTQFKLSGFQEITMRHRRVHTGGRAGECFNKPNICLYFILLHIYVIV